MTSSFLAAAGSDPTSVLAFIGPTVTVTVAAGQKVFMTVSKSLGSTVVGGASGLDLYPCYKSTASGSPLLTLGAGIFDLRTPQNTRYTFSINGDFAPGVGTFTIGMCGKSQNPANWNNNEYGYITTFVHN